MNPYMPPADPAAAHLPPSEGRPGVTELAVELLRQTKPWVQLVAILTLLFAGFMGLGGLAMIAVSALGPRTGGPEIAVFGVVYLPLAALYVYPGVKLWKYGSAIQRLSASRDAVDLEAALREQKSFWKFTGILAIVAGLLYVLVFVGMLTVGLIAGGAHR